MLECTPVTRKEQIPAGEIIQIQIPGSYQSIIGQAVQQFQLTESLPFTKDTGTRRKDYDLKQIIMNVAVSEEILEIRKKLESPALYDVLAGFLRLEKEAVYALKATRTGWMY